MLTRHRSASVTDESEIRKFPFHRLQHTVDRFIKVLKIDIDRLQQHKYNVEKYVRYGDYRLLNREQINASRTVQHLRLSLIDLDRTRVQVEDNDIPEFDRKTAKFRDEAGQCLTDFIEQCKQSLPTMKRNGSSSCRETLPPSLSPKHDFEELPSSDEVAMMQETADLEGQYEAMLQAEQSWQCLQNDLIELNDLMKKLAGLVYEQKEAVDSIEDNIDYSLANVQEANTQLSLAARYKTALYPLAGGLMGCAIGGPVGMVAGIKMGMGAALGGGLLGLTSGRWLKRYNEKQKDFPPAIEMQKTPASASCPSNLNSL